MAEPELAAIWRPARAAPAGALVLLHGRGADEHDLLPLAEALDPAAELVSVLPRGPLALPPGGAHWYRLGGLPTPEPTTFLATLARLAAWLDALPAQTGVPLARTVVGGFSQGCVMTHALAFGAGRPALLGTIHLSGFVPQVAAFPLDPAAAAGRPAFVAHGTLDPVISVEWGRQARQLLEEAGLQVDYREDPVGHTIAPATVAELRLWLAKQYDQKD